jgi:phosphoserine phosphatase
MLPVHLKYQLELLENRAGKLPADRIKIALFDLDNTLLVGDIGEAVFVQLLTNGLSLKCTWEEYQSFLRRDVSAAYRLVVESMAGLTIREVEEATVKVLKNPDSTIKYGKAEVPVPRPHPGMKKFVMQLRKLKYNIYVISASNQTSVRIAAEEFFGISPECSFGIETKITGGRLSATLVKPYPIGGGKKEVYHKHIGPSAPLVTATDSINDVQMLSLTDPVGLSVWVGKNRAEFKAVKEQIGQPQRFCFVPRPRNYSLMKRVRTFGEQRSSDVVSSTVFAEM